MSKTYTHELFVRSTKPGSFSVLIPVAATVMETDEPQEGLIRACDDSAKGMLEPPDALDAALGLDAAIYKVNGEVEYFVSKYLFLWPNFTDREDRARRPARKVQR